MHPKIIQHLNLKCYPKNVWSETIVGNCALNREFICWIVYVDHIRWSNKRKPKKYKRAKKKEKERWCVFVCHKEKVCPEKKGTKRAREDNIVTKNRSQGVEFQS